MPSKNLLAGVAARGLVASTLFIASLAAAQDARPPADNSDIVVIAPESRSIHAESQQTDLGPLGTVSIQDTPNAINVVPRALIEQQQLKNLPDIFRYIPSVQGDGVRPYSRGFQGSVVQNSRIDGLNIVTTTDYAAEQFERVDVLNGLSGAIYGPSNPAGLFQYVLKRPTEKPLTYIRLGYGDSSLWLQSADVSRTIADGAVGLRLNLLNEFGTAYISSSDISRQLVSAAVDFHLASRTTIETNFSYYRFESLGFSPTFAVGANLPFPKDIDPKQSLYGQTYGGNRNRTLTTSARLKQGLGDDWNLLLGAGYQTADRDSTAVTDTITDLAGHYTATTSSTAASRFTIFSNQAYLNGKFSTGPISHDFAIGTNGFDWRNFNPKAGRTITLGSASLADPIAFAEPSFPDFHDRYRSARAQQQSFVITDTLHAGDHWALSLTGSESWLKTQNTSLDGRVTSSSNDWGFSPSVSLVYKPTERLTTYVTYASSIQQGDTAPVGTLNANDILPPFRSKQWEAGAKLGLQKIDVTLSAFSIERPFAVIDPVSTIFKIEGTQRNRGVELMVNGEILPRLTAFGGVAYLDPKLLDTGVAATSDKRILGLSNWTATMLLSWQPPGANNLWLDSFVRYGSDRPTDNLNRFFAPSYATLNLGAKNIIHLHGADMTLRLDVINVTNERYLINLAPAGLNGYTGAGNASANLGRPRSVQISAGIAL